MCGGERKKGISPFLSGVLKVRVRVKDKVRVKVKVSQSELVRDFTSGQRYP